MTSPDDEFAAQPEALQPGNNGAAATAAAQESVCVAVNVRPLIESELIEGCKPTLYITPGEPQAS